MADNKQQLPFEAPGRRHWGDLLKHRWPTVLGVALASLTALDLEINREFVSFLSALIVFMAIIYLSAAVLDRRSSAWVVFLLGLVVLTVLKLLDLNVAAVLVFLAAALVFLVLGLVRKQWRKASSLPLETGGMIAFSAVALIAPNLELVWAGYLVVAALFSHSAWDAVHLWRNRVVARTYAEFCAVLDVVLGLAILVMMLKV